MAKSALLKKRSPLEKQTNPSYNDMLEISSNQKPNNIYLEFDNKENVYCYATEPNVRSDSSGASAGTPSIYYEGRVGPSSRNENTRYSNSRERQNDAENLPIPTLRDSTNSTSTIYDKIGEPELQFNVAENNIKKSACSLGRIVAVLTVLVVLLLISGILIYKFVINKSNSQGQDCNSIPEVMNGKVDDSRIVQASAIVTIVCTKGYQMDGNETMTCEDGKWTAQPVCVPVKCRAYPLVGNGTVNGTSHDFSSTAEIVCDPGFMQEGPGTITCQADGNWTSTPNCVQHPCGIYTPAKDLVPVMDSNSTYLTRCFKCQSGLMMMNGSDHCVTCHQGAWEGKPECEVEGVVSFNTHQIVYNAGDIVSLTCSVRNSPNWQSVGLARAVFPGSDIEPLYNIVNTNGAIEVKQLSDKQRFNVSYVTDTNGVNLVFKLDKVQCGDAGVYTCGNIVGNIESPEKVKSTNTSLHVKGQPGIPQWVLFPDDIIYGSTKRFKCSGEVGNPKGYIDVESNFDGNFSLFLTTKLTQDSNNDGIIDYFTDEKTACGYKRSVFFTIRTISSRYHQKGLRCVSRPPASMTNGQAAISNTRNIEVIPDDYCSKNDTVRSHPYHCDRFVLCGNGQVTGVPAGCADGSCFNNIDSTCYPCEQLGGCSITDIYIDGYDGWINEGHSATLICKVKYFEGLTDIVISKYKNNTLVAKLSDENLESDATGMTYVLEKSYINGTRGQLSLRFDPVHCQDEGQYYCIPVGSGKYSEDETGLTLKDNDGNTAC